MMHVTSGPKKKNLTGGERESIDHDFLGRELKDAHPLSFYPRNGVNGKKKGENKKGIGVGKKKAKQGPCAGGGPRGKKNKGRRKRKRKNSLTQNRAKGPNFIPHLRCSKRGENQKRKKESKQNPTEFGFKKGGWQSLSRVIGGQAQSCVVNEIPPHQKKK